ncbi:YugN family protein [Paenibacillus septentrionalis]|uniref:YugN family protein n=1 Tax=Paenibacillus septentrionalis TaxID=429342 RepID=A0ABW1V2X5_9BACL
MLSIPSTFIEGKHAYYGEIKDAFEERGFVINGNWEYYKAFFDHILHQHEGETIYLRLPIYVLQGKLDRDDAFFEFGQPFLLKHLVHTGIASDDNDFGILDAIGLAQFQKPLDPDDKIEKEDKWRHAGLSAIERLAPIFH